MDAYSSKVHRYVDAEAWVIEVQHGFSSSAGNVALNHSSARGQMLSL